MVIDGLGDFFVSDVFCHPHQLAEEQVGLVFRDESVDLARGFFVVKISTLQREPLKECLEYAKQDPGFRQFDEIDGAAIRLKCLKRLLFIDVWVVVEGAEHDFVVL